MGRFGPLPDYCRDAGYAGASPSPAPASRKGRISFQIAGASTLDEALGPGAAAAASSPRALAQAPPGSSGQNARELAPLSATPP